MRSTIHYVKSRKLGHTGWFIKTSRNSATMFNSKKDAFRIIWRSLIDSIKIFILGTISIAKFSYEHERR